MYETVSIAMSAAAGWLAGALVWQGIAGRRDGAPRRVTPSFDALDHELERARRYERPFVLLQLGASLGAVTPLRAIDISWVDDGCVTILLPEMGRSEGMACLRRLAVATSQPARLAVFPEDGLTRGALLAALARQPAGGEVRAIVPAPRSADVPQWVS